MTTRYIFTGTPGCGKTSLLKALNAKGYQTIEEAATDVIAAEQAVGNMTPWEQPAFLDKITILQQQRQLEAECSTAPYQFYDRSPICTYALALYLGFAPSIKLINEITRIQQHGIYAKHVFFIENLGFITNTDARKISFAESLRFEKIHHAAYQKVGYKCIMIPAAPLEDRVAQIVSYLSINR